MPSPPDLARAESGQPPSPRSQASPPTDPGREGVLTLGRRRQKISLACDDCRAKKIRCDGLRPQCTACRRKGSERPCRYYQTEGSRGSGSRGIIKSLQERLAQLEGRVSGEQAGREPSVDVITGSTLDSTSPSGLTERSYPSVGSDRLEEQRTKRRSLPQEPAQFPSPISSMSTTTRTQQGTHGGLPPSKSQDELSDQPDELGEVAGSINAMGMAGLTPHTSVSREFYGMSSAASFFNHIQDRLHNDAASSRDCEPQTGSRRQVKDPPQQAGALCPDSAHSDDFHLPPRHAADHLIDLYWNRVQCLYPYVHWPTFLESYNRLWMSDAKIKESPPLTGVGLGGPQCSPRVFYCALNVMFALAVQFSDASAQEKRDRAQPFARRARHLLRIDYLDHGDISLVQALLIMAHYLQSTNLPTRCWHVAGLALRMAQGLGLHLDIELDKSPLSKEMRKRVWFGCICLDVVLAMTLGRPTMSARKSTLSLPVTLKDEEELHNPPSDGSSLVALSTTAFLAQTVRLYKILDNILCQVYDPWKENEAGGLGETQETAGSSPQLACLVTLDAQLDHFETTIPDILRWDSHNAQVDSDGVLQRQRNVLRTRLLHSRVMLYRPPFVLLCQQTELAVRQPPSATTPGMPRKSQNRLPSLLADRCSVACIENAQALVEHINTTSQGTETGAPWFNAYYVYHAAMVLTLAALCPPIRKQLDPATVSESWQHCLNFLNRTIEHEPESFKYLQALKEISRYVNPENSETVSNESLDMDRDARQDLMVNHILNSCLDPSLAPWLDDPFQVYAYPEFNDSEPGQSVFRDDGAAFTDATVCDGPGFVSGEWSGEGS